MSSRTIVRQAAVAASALAVVAAAASCSAPDTRVGAGSATPDQPSSSAAPSSGTPSPGGASTPGEPSGAAPPSSAGPSTPPVTAVDPAPVTGGSDLQVALTYVSWFAEPGGVDASGVVTGVVETGGTCTLSLNRSGVVVEATSTGLADASSTSCGTLSVQADELTAGAWQATLSYASAAGTATSAPATVEVPAR